MVVFSAPRGGHDGIRPGSRALVGVAAAAMCLVGLAVPARADYATRPAATWAANNTVFAIAVRGNAVYLGGKFTRLRNPATGRTIPAAGLAALNRTTGRPIWTASANGVVRSLAVSADGGTLFAGGGFTVVNGRAASHLVALSPATGASVAGWRASASGRVRALAVSGSHLYVGGQFGRVNGVGRGGLARLAVGSGALEPWRSGTMGGRPWAIKLSADGLSLVVGGNFTGLGGAPRSFLGSVSTATGAVTGWAPKASCSTCYVVDIDADTASSYVASSGPGGHLNAYAVDTGKLRWSKFADGNVQAVAVFDGLVYAGGHFDPVFAGQTRHQLAAVNAGTGVPDPFAPHMIKPFPGVFALVALPDGLFVGGGFSGVGSATAQAHYAELDLVPGTL